ncbi:ABC transporter permease [Natranaerobius trueperi]|uniref:Choline ABC transporter permease n=1 Tax=Natranaerobius trueperi TaxID=759412 RepID=A0A226C276_9FIRM|nr:ABC transporter permease [Natranaerobius trueperi]OWZ84549.1 choline ABC transporter permease [Natranaerobius trueperi]
MGSGFFTFQGFLDYISTREDMIMQAFIEHSQLILITGFLAITIGIFLGLLATYYKTLANFILLLSQILMTIPSFAMIGLLLPLFGIGTSTAVLALVLYSLLPIVRNTYIGIKELDLDVLEAARGMGMSEVKILLKVKIPLALPVMIAGIRTAIVMVVGIAAIASLVGVGGFGDFIFRGIARSSSNMILTGALGVSILAITIDIVLGRLEQYLLTKQC